MAGFLTSCVSNARQDALKPAGHYARIADHLFKYTFWVAVAVFILVEGLIIVCVVRFRARSDDDNPVQVHGNFKAEITWTIIPFLLLTVVGIFTIKSVFDVNRTPKGAAVVKVDVTGHRWWWEYRYKDLGIVTANELHIPVHRPVTIRLTSVDVIHNFWPPKLAGKVYAIPGRTNHMVIEADKPATYYGQCAEYCGLSHANMRLRVVAMAQGDFDRWVSEQQTPPADPASLAGTTSTSTDPAAKGAGLFLSKGCAGCHTINGFAAGNVGPNLTHLKSRSVFAGALFQMNDVNLRRWLHDPPAEKPGSVMPNLNLSDSEVNQLIAYLDTLK
jgi:cytochrome c oxidase subunit 2